MLLKGFGGGLLLAGMMVSMMASAQDKVVIAHRGASGYLPEHRLPAKASNLQVHPYRVRSDKLPDYVTDVNGLFEVLYRQADVDGLFTDFPDKAVQFLAGDK